MNLAPLNRRSENIGLAPVVIPELKFGDVQRQIFGADFVEATNNATQVRDIRQYNS
jgi:hypothetical protein